MGGREVERAASRRGGRRVEMWRRGGIRTPGRIAPTPDFESGPFNQALAPLRARRARLAAGAPWTPGASPHGRGLPCGSSSRRPEEQREARRRTGFPSVGKGFSQGPARECAGGTDALDLSRGFSGTGHVPRRHLACNAPVRHLGIGAARRTSRAPDPSETARKGRRDDAVAEGRGSTPARIPGPRHRRPGAGHLDHRRDGDRERGELGELARRFAHGLRPVHLDALGHRHRGDFGRLRGCDGERGHAVCGGGGRGCRCLHEPHARRHCGLLDHVHRERGRRPGTIYDPARSTTAAASAPRRRSRTAARRARPAASHGRRHRPAATAVANASLGLAAVDGVARAGATTTSSIRAGVLTLDRPHRHPERSRCDFTWAMDRRQHLHRGPSATPRGIDEAAVRLGHDRHGRAARRARRLRRCPRRRRPHRPPTTATS